MKQETTLKEDETLDYCLSKIGNLIIFVFKKFNLKTHIECEFVSEECERFNMIFRTENYNNEQQEKTYSEQEIIDLLTMQRENCYVAILGETRNEEIATIALNAPEPGGRNGSWKNNKL